MRTAPKKRNRLPEGTFRVTVVILVAFGLLLWLRGDALFSPIRGNPDEAELLASGKRAMSSLVPYRDYTTPTFLFLWPLVLGLLGKLGLALTLPTAHFLSGLTYLYLILAGWYTLSRYVHWRYALACITPAAVVLFAGDAKFGSDSWTHDYVSLGTELLPIFLLTVALHVVHTGNPLQWRPRLALAASLTGASVLAKPQALPLAVGFLAACIVAVSAQEGFAAASSTAVRRRGLRVITTWAVLFSLVPIVGAFAWMALGQTLHTFFEEPVSLQLDYMFRREGFQLDWSAPSFGDRLKAIGEALISVPFAFVVLLAAGDARSGSVILSRPWLNGRRFRGLVVLVALTLSAILATVVPYPIAPHYLNFVFAGCIFAAVGSCAVLGPRSPQQVTTPSPGYRFPATIVIAALALSFALVASTFFDVSKRDGMRWEALFDSSAAVPENATGPGWETVRSHCPPGSRVMVWGWASELYSYNDWVPASRYVNPWVLAPRLTKREIYRRRTEEELAKQLPACLVEAVGPSFFADISADRGIATTLPRLKGLLSRCYERHTVTSGPQSRLTYYVLRVTCRKKETVPGAVSGSEAVS